jgi:hypothetical protein
MSGSQRKSGEAMTPRPPSEVSDARLREIRTLEEAYSAVAEARAAMAKAEGERTCKHYTARYSAEHDNYYCANCGAGMGAAYYNAAKRAESAESSLREHAEAIGVLRDALRDLKVVAADNLPSVVARRSARVQDALQKAIKKAADTMRAPIPALASRLSASREAMGEAISFYANPANWLKRDHYSSPSQDFPAWQDPSPAEIDNGKMARAALPASPSNKEDT